MSRGFSSSFFSLLLLALSIAVTAGATPLVQVNDNLVRLPFAKRLNFTGSTKLLARDQARVRNLRARANAKLSGLTLTDDAVVSVPAENQVVDYVVNVSASLPTLRTRRRGANLAIWRPMLTAVHFARSALALPPPRVRWFSRPERARRLT